jgi:GxxExxY protein
MEPIIEETSVVVLSAKQKKALEVAERKKEREAKKMQKEREKEQKRLLKEAKKAVITPKPSPPVVLPPCSRADLIRRLANEVCAELGPGHTESVYHNAMKIQLQDEGFKYESERDIPVLFKGRYVGTVRADVIVNHEIVLEFKIAGKIDDAVLQCRQYMKLQSIPYGFVVLFPKHEGGEVVVRDCMVADDTQEPQ